MLPAACKLVGLSRVVRHDSASTSSASVMDAWPGYTHLPEHFGWQTADIGILVVFDQSMDKALRNYLYQLTIPCRSLDAPIQANVRRGLSSYCISIISTFIPPSPSTLPTPTKTDSRRATRPGRDTQTSPLCLSLIHWATAASDSYAPHWHPPANDCNAVPAFRQRAEPRFQRLYRPTASIPQVSSSLRPGLSLVVSTALTRGHWQSTGTLPSYSTLLAPTR